MYDDLAAMEDILRASGLDWTVIRPPQLTDKPPSGTYRTAFGQNLVAPAVQVDQRKAVPRSGRREIFPEVAEARWMSLSEAREIMLASQLPLLDALQEKLKG